MSGRGKSSNKLSKKSAKSIFLRIFLKTNNFPAKGVKKTKKKTKKDPNAPKKALTAWILYSTSVRPKVKEENPNAS